MLETVPKTIRIEALLWEVGILSTNSSAWNASTHRSIFVRLCRREPQQIQC
jgi:hypothetical protein